MIDIEFASLVALDYLYAFEPFTLIASLIAAGSAIVAGIQSRKTKHEDTIEMMHEQNELNLGNQQRTIDLDKTQINRAVNDARNSGINPLSVLGSPTYSASAVSSPSTTPQPGFDTSVLAPILGFAESLGSLNLESKKVDSDIAVNNAQIDKIIEETEEIRNRNSNVSSKNKAIQKSLAEKGIEVPEIGATGFLEGLDQADEYFTQNTNRQFRRLFDSNMLKIEELKSSPEYLEKVQAGMYAELDKKVVDLDTARELLKGAKLDNTKAVQEIRINEMRYAVIKTELAEKVFNLKLAPARASLELQKGAVDLKNAYADLDTKKLQQKELVIKIDSDFNKLMYDVQKNPRQWYNKMNEDYENGNYLDYGADFLNTMFYGLLDSFGTAMGSIFK